MESQVVYRILYVVTASYNKKNVVLQVYNKLLILPESLKRKSSTFIKVKSVLRPLILFFSALTLEAVF
jgi:hypothetical protein